MLKSSASLRGADIFCKLILRLKCVKKYCVPPRLTQCLSTPHKHNSDQHHCQQNLLTMSNMCKTKHELPWFAGQPINLEAMSVTQSVPLRAHYHENFFEDKERADIFCKHSVCFDELATLAFYCQSARGAAANTWMLYTFPKRELQTSRKMAFASIFCCIKLLS